MLTISVQFMLMVCEEVNGLMVPILIEVSQAVFAWVTFWEDSGDEAICVLREIALIVEMMWKGLLREFEWENRDWRERPGWLGRDLLILDPMDWIGIYERDFDVEIEMEPIFDVGLRGDEKEIDGIEAERQADFEEKSFVLNFEEPRGETDEWAFLKAFEEAIFV